MRQDVSSAAGRHASINGLPGEGRHEGLVPRNDVLTVGFIRFSFARTLTRIIFLVPCLRSPRNPEGVANQESYLRCSKRFDHIGVTLSLSQLKKDRESNGRNVVVFVFMFVAIERLRFTFTAYGKRQKFLRIENKQIKTVQNDSSGQNWHKTTYFCVEAINSKRKIRGKLGHVVQIHVCRKHESFKISLISIFSFVLISARIILNISLLKSLNPAQSLSSCLPGTDHHNHLLTFFQPLRELLTKLTLKTWSYILWVS